MADGVGHLFLGSNLGSKIWRRINQVAVNHRHGNNHKLSQQLRIPQITVEPEPTMVSVKPDLGPLQVVQEKAALQRNDQRAEELCHSLIFDVQRCAFYHGMRARFFDSFGKAGSLLSFVSGAGALTSLLSKLGNTEGVGLLATSLTASAAFFSGLNMIVGFSRKARDHEVLRSKYYALRVEIEKARGDVSKLEELKCKMLSYFADGSVFLTALDMIAHNRTCLAQNPDAHVFNIPWRHRLLAHFWSFTGYYSKPRARVGA